MAWNKNNGSPLQVPSDKFPGSVPCHVLFVYGRNAANYLGCKNYDLNQNPWIQIAGLNWLATARFFPSKGSSNFWTSSTLMLPRWQVDEGNSGLSYSIARGRLHNVNHPFGAIYINWCIWYKYSIYVWCTWTWTFKKHQMWIGSETSTLIELAFNKICWFSKHQYDSWWCSLGVLTSMCCWLFLLLG